MPCPFHTTNSQQIFPLRTCQFVRRLRRLDQLEDPRVEVAGEPGKGLRREPVRLGLHVLLQDLGVVGDAADALGGPGLRELLGDLVGWGVRGREEEGGWEQGREGGGRKEEGRMGGGKGGRCRVVLGIARRA